jgi:hypothetical protein
VILVHLLIGLIVREPTPFFRARHVKNRGKLPGNCLDVVLMLSHRRKSNEEDLVAFVVNFVVVLFGLNGLGAITVEQYAERFWRAEFQQWSLQYSQCVWGTKPSAAIWGND